MSSEQADVTAGQSEEQMRAAYEAELNRITSSEMILQSAVSLLNIGGRRLGLSAPAAPGSPPTSNGERDLEQVSDAIDAARALMPILEKRMPGELGPLRDAIAQLQMAYAREVQAGAEGGAKAGAEGVSTTATAGQAAPKQAPATESPETPAGEQQQGPGPAQASGRLWVPGR